MGIWELLLAFYAYTLFRPSKCLASLELSRDKIVLNLASADNPKVYILEGFDNGTVFGSYIVKNGFSLSLLRDGPQTLWTAKEDERGVLAVLYQYGDLSLAVVDTRIGEESGLYCHEKRDGKWTQISQEDLETNLRRIRMENSGYDLDIYKIDPYKVAVDEEEKDGVVIHLYTPRDGVEILSVSDRGVLVWSAENYEKCGYAKVTTWDDFELMHLYLQVPKSDRYFQRKPGSGWVKVSKENFYKKKREAKMGGQPTLPSVQPTTRGVTLDIAKPDRTKIVKSPRKCNGLRCRAFSPKNGVNIVAILDGDYEIWRASGREKCTLATLYTKGKSKLITLYLQDGEKTTNLRFEKRDGEWNNVTKRDLYDLLEKIKGPKIKNWEDPHELNISYPNVTLVELTRNVTSKSTTTTYTPKQDVSILTVVDNANEIWRISGNHIKLVYVRRVETEDVELLSIYTKKGGVPRFLYFRKEGQIWKEIQSDEYYRKLNA